MRRRKASSGDIVCSRKTRRIVPHWPSMASCLPNSRAIEDAAIGLIGQAVVDMFAGDAFKFGEHAADRLGVVPDVRAGAVAAADALPAPEAAALHAQAGGGGQGREVEETCGPAASAAASSHTMSHARGGCGNRMPRERRRGDRSPRGWMESARHSSGPCPPGRRDSGKRHATAKLTVASSPGFRVRVFPTVPLGRRVEDLRVVSASPANPGGLKSALPGEVKTPAPSSRMARVMSPMSLRSSNGA